MINIMASYVFYHDEEKVMVFTHFAQVPQGGILCESLTVTRSYTKAVSGPHRIPDCG